MSKERDLLLQRLQDHLLPQLAQRGFAPLPLSEEERKSPELRGAFPLGYLRRDRDGKPDLLEIQFERGGAAKFVLNFGIAPPGGVDLPWKHFDLDEVRVSTLPEWYRLHSSSGSLKWFEFPWMALGSDRETQAAKVVDQVSALLPEVEAWFETGAVGPHMKRVGFPLRGAR